MEYVNLSELVRKKYSGYIENAVKALTAPELPERRLEAYLTATRWRQYRAGTISRDQAVEYAIKRSEKQYERREAATLAELERVAEAPEVKSVSIMVEWRKSRTWGHNPTAEIIVDTSEGCYTAKGHASGCGYDKRTVAVGEALNQIDAVRKMLYDCKEGAIKSTGKTENRDCIAYGAGYGALPHFEGGVGMSSFEAVFNACGFILTHCHETKTSDYYYFVKKEVTK